MKQNQKCVESGPPNSVKTMIPYLNDIQTSQFDQRMSEIT